MRYREFRERIAGTPIFSSSLVPHLGGSTQVLRNQLGRWEKRGLIHKLRRGLYVLNEADRRRPLSRLFAANQIYAPSYVSTEYALGYYGLIPERVADVTSVTPRKTYRTANALGRFVYQHVAQRAFSHYTVVDDEAGNPCLIASPEKALADFVYLNLARFPEGREDVFEESFRFQNTEKLDGKRLLRAAALFESAKLMRVMKQFIRSARTRT